MNTTSTKPKPSSKFVLATVLSGSITCVFSIIYIVLCILALTFRFACGTGDVPIGSAHLTTTLYRAYIQDNECPSAISQSNVTSDYVVFVLVCITLAAAVVCLVAAIALMAALFSEQIIEYISIFAYGYVGVCVASFGVDLTLAIHFGIDYSNLSVQLDQFSAGLSFNYDTDMIRIAAFILMVVSLKGFISHVINLVLLVLIVVYLLEYLKSLDQYEHSIHKLGAIKAFDPKRPRESVFQDREMRQSTPVMSNGGSHMNYGYMNDDESPRGLRREDSRRERDDFAPSIDRSYSWQQGPTAAGRPFSYLEEAKRQTPPPRPQPQPSPPSERQWRRAPWPGPAPPVPAPDYSPQAPRRLKSALKPAYM